MKLEYFSQKNYNELNNWWLKHSHPIIPFSSLPYGVIVFDNNKSICASFLYVFDKCDMCQIAWTTTNPECGLKERYNGINLAIDGLLVLAKKLNKKNVMCFSNSTGISKIMEKKGLLSGKPHIIHSGSF